jgi:hypothetical protein
MINNDYNEIIGFLDDDNFNVYYTSKYSDYSQYGC